MLCPDLFGTRSGISTLSMTDLARLLEFLRACLSTLLYKSTTGIIDLEMQYYQFLKQLPNFLVKEFETTFIIYLSKVTNMSSRSFSSIVLSEAF